jgi:hypothetical protein
VFENPIYPTPRGKNQALFDTQKASAEVLDFADLAQRVFRKVI